MVLAAGTPAGMLAPLAAGLVPLPMEQRLLIAASAVAAAAMKMLNDRRTAVLAHRAFTDRLTGLYSYDYFVEALDHELRRAHRYGGNVSLVVLDLDAFKRFNDEHGHAAGNLFLRQVGELVQRTARDSDMPARFGGEELVVLVQGTTREAAQLAERIRRQVAVLRVDTSHGPGGHHAVRRGRGLPGAELGRGAVRGRRRRALRGQAARQEPGPGLARRRGAGTPRPPSRL